MCWTATNTAWVRSFGRKRRVRGAHGVFRSTSTTSSTTATTAASTTS